MTGRGLNAIGYLCIAYLVWRPVSTPVLLYSVLAVLAVVSLLKIGASTYIAKPFAYGVILLATAGLYAALNGASHSAPGLLQQAMTWFGGLALWSIWAASLGRRFIRMTITVITVATAALSVFILLYVAGQTRHLPLVIPEVLLRAQDAGFAETADGPAIRLYGLSSLIIAGPLAVAGFMAGRDRLMPPRSLLAVAAVLATLAALVAGRRALVMVIVLSPILTYVLMRLLRTPRDIGSKRLSNVPIIGAGAVLLIAALWPRGDGLPARITGSVADLLAVYFGIGRGSGGTKTDGDHARVEQTEQLLGGWHERPITGSGMGAVLNSGYYRSADRPWLFELQYHQLLFTFGLLGMLAMAAAVAGMWMGIRSAAARCPEHVPVIVAASVAATSLLIADASNPYLQAVGHGWGLALVVGVVNALAGSSRELSEPIEDEHDPLSDSRVSVRSLR